ncbi:hypothetical protein Pla144_26020 [Bythopirellula polymerisocia]|uniref:Uncharacterized protein n=1 Tax=Bythopirellula polymerisocia TaxID=2528003 RepID=A0A5C6CVG8_9BACT|nr:hypothetical protein Pla144_26020 [Bythopirellula polymerisocia]
MPAELNGQDCECGVIFCKPKRFVPKYFIPKGYQSCVRMLNPLKDSKDFHNGH